MRAMSCLIAEVHGQDPNMLASDFFWEWKMLVLFCPLFFVLLPSFLHFQVIVCNFVAFLFDFVVQCGLTFDLVHFLIGGGGS